MADPIKRLKYFDGQFLRAPDLNAEQAYHAGKRRLHNRLFHTWGIAQGLQVSFIAGTSIATISAGMALDSAGRELVLADSASSPDCSSMKGRTIFLTLTYQESLTDPSSDAGASGNTRCTEAPKIEIVATPADPSINLVLVRLVIDANGLIASKDDGVDPNARRVAGIGGADVVAHSVTLSDANPQNTWARLSAGTLKSTLQVNGSISAAAGAAVNGNLQAQGATFAAPVSVQAQPLAVGRLFVSGGTMSGYGSLAFNAWLPPNSAQWNFPDMNRPAATIMMDDSSGFPHWIFYTTTTSAKQTWLARLQINGTTGDVSVTASGGTVYVFSTVNSRGAKLASDIRLKQDIREITDPLDKLAAIRGVYYRRTDVESRGREIGVIAQDVERVLPELVSTSGETGAKAVDYGKLTALLVEVYKQLCQRVTALEEKLAALKIARAAGF